MTGVLDRADLWRAWLDGRPWLRKAARNAGYLFADRLLRLCIGVIVGVWTARYFGPHTFGIYSFALAFVYLLNPITTLGLENIVVRDLVKEPGSGNEILGTAWLLRLAGSLVALVACNVTIGFLRPDDWLTRALVAVVAIGPLFQTMDTADLWFQSQLQAKRSVGARGVAFGLAAALKLGLILLEAPILVFACAGVAECLLAASALAIAYMTAGQRISDWRFRQGRAKQMLRVSWPLAVSSMAIITYTKIDHVMLGEMLGPEAVGVYAAATRVSELWYFLPMGIASSAFPVLIEVRGRDPRLYAQRMQQLFDGMAILAVVIAAPVALLAPLVVRVLYGEAYAAAGAVLAIHIWCSIFVFLGVAQLPWDAAEGFTKLAMSRTLTGAAVKIALNTALIGKFGLPGAAFATLVSQACSAWLANACHQKTRGIFIQQTRALLVFRHAFARGAKGNPGPPSPN